MVGPYTLNPQVTQQSITDGLRAMYPHVTFIEDGMVDDQYYEDPETGDLLAIPTFSDGSVKPFVLVWYSQMKRGSKNHSFSSYKIDPHSATVDLVAVTRKPSEGRLLLNDIGDNLVGFKPENGGRLYKSASLWGDSRQVLDTDNRPSRWARTDRFDFGIQANRVLP